MRLSGVQTYLIMLDLQQDLTNAQRRVTEVLTEYEKASEDIIKSNYTAQLHVLLDSIAAFDHARVKDCELVFKDDTVARYIHTISDKIRNVESPKAPPQTERTSKSVDRPSKEVKEVRRESRLTDKKEDGKKGGIFEFVRNKFSSKEKKIAEMIFPEEEPSCYYDPVTKTYIFEGEEPQAPKAIQRPPTAAAKKGKDELKRSTSDDSELGQLTAPPAFKRKSTPGTNFKGKAKLQEQAEAVKEIEPVTFAKVMDTINESYRTILERSKNGTYERHVQLPHQNSQSIAQFINFTERTLQVSEEISTHEHKLIQKWGKLLASESRELKIMQKVIKQIKDSAQTYNAILSKIDGSSLRERQARIIREEVVVVKEVIKEVQKDIIKEVEKQVVKEVFNQRDNNNQSSQTQWIEQPREDYGDNQTTMRRDLEQAKRNYYNISLNLSHINDKKQRLQHLVKRYQAKIEQLQIAARERQSMITYLTGLTQQSKHSLKEITSTNEELSHRVKRLTDELKAYQERQKHITSEHAEEISHLTNQYKSQIQRNITEISELESANYTLQQEKDQILQQLQQQRMKKNTSIDKVTSEIGKQKTKIQSQLKFYQQKQKLYANSLQNLQGQQNLIQEYDSALSQENQILNTILEKRLQLSKNPQSEDPYGYIKHSQEAPSNQIILQLSDIVNSITQTHLDRLQAYNRYYVKLHRKYRDTKEALNKIKSNTANENMSLNRNVTRLKGLLDTYKTAKDEAEERSSQLELQCDKLKKKLQHYKEEDQFNKSYLSRLRTSKIHSQNQSVLSLQEDKDELTSEIEQLQKEVAQKEEALNKNQNDLQDLLINYEKNQMRLLQIQKRYKQNEKELRQAKQQLEQQGNQNKLLELKLQNIRDKYDQIQNKQQSRIKNAESALEKKIKLIRHDLDQASTRQEHLKMEIEDLRQESQLRLAALQQSHANIIGELKDKIAQKDSQISEIIILLDETNQKLEVQQQQRAKLLLKNNQLVQVQKELNRKLSEIIDEHLKEIAIHNESQQSLNSMVETLVQRYNSIKSDQSALQSSYDQKIYQLEQALESCLEDSKDLSAQIEQYSQLLQQSSQRFQEIKQQQKKRTTQGVSKQGSKKIKELEQLVSALGEQLKETTEESKAFEQIIEKMSEDMARLAANEQQIGKERTDLEEKLVYKDREIETLTNLINKKSEELMIKTEELLEKDAILLEQEELSVMRKEQLDEVKNQLLNLANEQKQKEKQINELTSDLQELAEQLANSGGSGQGHIKEVQYLNTQIYQLKQSNNLKDQQITNFAENFYKLNFELQQKSSQLERLNEGILNLANSAKQVQELSNAIVEINASLQESESLVASLQKQNVNKQSIINELQTKLTYKQAELTLLLERLSAAEKEINKEIDQSDEIEGEMQYLLKEISAKETELQKIAEAFRLKSFEYDQLLKRFMQQQTELEKRKQEILQSERENKLITANLSTANNKIEALQTEANLFASKSENLMEIIKKLSQQKLKLESDLAERGNQKQQLVELIYNLQKQIDSKRECIKRQHRNTQLEVKEQQKLIEQLIADINAKDQSIIDKQRQIEQKQQALRQLRSQLQLNQQLIRETKHTVAQKSKLITEAQIVEQEKLRIIVELKKNLKESEERCSELENNLTDMAEVIESQEGLIQSFKNEAVANHTGKAVEALTAELKQRNGQISELKKKLQQLKATFVIKEGQYEKKIEHLERDNIAITSLKNNNKKLEQSLKALQEENKQLTDQKKEIIISNNYLVGINQKLIADKSPHNSKQVPKAHPVPPSEKPGLAEKGEAQSPRSKQPKQGKKQSSGIFGGLLQGLFLTPTETERLRK